MLELNISQWTNSIKHESKVSPWMVGEEYDRSRPHPWYTCSCTSWHHTFPRHCHGGGGGERGTSRLAVSLFFLLLIIVHDLAVFPQVLLLINVITLMLSRAGMEVDNDYLISLIIVYLKSNLFSVKCQSCT